MDKQHIYQFNTIIRPIGQRIEEIPKSPLLMELKSPLAGSCPTILLRTGGNAILYVRTKARLADEDLQTLANEIQGITNSFFDANFFMTGQVLTAEIVSVTLQDPSLKPLGNHTSATVKQVAEQNGLDKLSGFFPQAITVTPIRFALGDLRQATLFPDDTPFYAYRVLETIRDAITDESNKTKAWNGMHKALHTSQAYFEPITEASKSIRHGSPIPISKADRESQIGKAWTVIYRFWEYIKNNRQPLDLSKFPSL